MAVEDDDGIERRGLMFVLSAPPGAGATTLSRLLIERTPGLRMSVSVTTRAMRPGEVNGRDYTFVDKSKFDAMVRAGELLEWATVFGNLYGTPRAAVEAALSAGEDVLFDIDWQGTQQLREKASADVVSVFILPPSLADLEKRMVSRAQDSHDVIRRRMSRASHEMSHWAEYDYVVMNEDIDAAFSEVHSILKAERLKRERRFGLPNRIRTAIEIWSTSLGNQDLTAAEDNNRSSPPTEPRSEEPSEGSSSPKGERSGTQSRESAFELLQARVALLESALAARPPGMGHNRGPNINDELSIDEAEIETFISRLRDQQAAAPVDLPELIEAAQVADPAVNKWRERLDDFAKGAFKGAGFVAGKVAAEKLAQAAWVQSVYSALQGVFESLMHWLTFF
ncbi:hypothetical protein BwSF12_43360 [Bradyrhizobium ottawaense]|nr:hypothetical protein BwSF12_43360 [Bradyrhizobium ottawaense]GMO85740.1 hypothetical protein BwSF19_44670 [Bradyrhizobium ottawaense]